MTRRTRRSFIGGVAATGMAATAGCLSFVTGKGPLSFEATQVLVATAALEATGYELVSEESPKISRSFTVAGQTRKVQVTNRLATYEKSIDFGPLGSVRAAVFAALATPKIEIAGRTFNPIEDMSNRELLEQLQSRYEGVTVNEQVGTYQVETLGTTATVERYDATATLQGRDVPIYLHIVRLPHGDDFLIGVGAHPQAVPGEKEDVRRMIAGLTHESSA
ncbi:MAG: DUF6517 family protein [Halanaeroarchaeum sp.]